MEDKLRKKPERLCSIDAARGYAMFWYIGGLALFMGLARVTGNQTLIDLADVQMRHAAWNGFTYADTGLPLFLFIMGMTFPFSAAKRERTGGSMMKMYLMIARRCVTMILLGWVYNGILSDFNFADMRYYSVLGRLGVAWALAGVIYLTCRKPWQRTAWCAGILIAYWLLLTFVSAPDAPDMGSFTMEGNIAGFVDRTLFPGHIYNEYYDPEGLLGTISSVSTVLMGMQTGWFISSDTIKQGKKARALCLFAAAILLMGSGLLWNLILPINKRLWTSSFVLFSGGFSLLVFTVFYDIMDVHGHDYGWLAPLRALGMNSIAAYLGYHLFGGFEETTHFLLGGLMNLLPEVWTPLIEACGGMAICWGILWFLYKKKIIIKIG